MFSLSNGLSLLRAPLALCFLSENTFVRLASIILAMFTDYIDGFLARKQRCVTQFGAILDPTMDKLFVFICLAIFLKERQIEFWQVCAILSRDFFLCLFGIYLYLSKKWHDYRFKSIQWGKVTTFLQFIVLISLTIKIKFSSLFYFIFVVFGLLAFIELCRVKKQKTTNI